MLISGRQATTLLFEAGLTQRQARAVLASGLAGMPVPTPGAHLYDEETVLGLAARPCLGRQEVALACPGALFVARRWVDVLAAPEDRVRALTRQWDLGVRGANVSLAVHLHALGPVPFVATVCGFVVLGAEITRLVGEPGGTTYRMELGEPGAWFETLADRRVRLGPGRDYVLMGW